MRGHDNKKGGHKGAIQGAALLGVCSLPRLLWKDRRGQNKIDVIRRLWRFEKHQFDDSTPRICGEATGDEFPISAEYNLVRGEDWQILKEVCSEDSMSFELLSSLQDVEREYRRMSRLAGIYEALSSLHERSGKKQPAGSLESAGCCR